MKACLGMQSVSMGASRPSSKRNPLFQLASTVAGIRERVAGIPVYTVANKKNELVLVAGEVGQLFCNCKQVASAMVHADYASAVTA